MSKLRYTLMAVVLGTGVMGCSFTHWSVYHCDDCDDFPMPAQGMAGAMMPGTYTGPPPQDSRRREFAAAVGTGRRRDVARQ